MDTNEEWILQRIGIRERHLVDPGTATSDELPKRHLADRGIPATDLKPLLSRR